MNSKPNILFVTTQYKVGERIYPIIPYLSKKYNFIHIKHYTPPHHGILKSTLELYADTATTKNNTYFDTLHPPPPHGISNLTI